MKRYQKQQEEEIVKLLKAIEKIFSKVNKVMMY
jgi:hypothetical protein